MQRGPSSSGVLLSFSFVASMTRRTLTAVAGRCKPGAADGDLRPSVVASGSWVKRYWNSGRRSVRCSRRKASTDPWGPLRPGRRGDCA